MTADGETPARKLLAQLAEKLRSRAKWSCRDGYYTTEIESAKNDAMREVLEGIASDIEEMLVPEPGESP